MLLTLGMIACIVTSAESTENPDKAIRIRKVRGRDNVILFVENEEAFDITVTLKVYGHHIKVIRLKPETETETFPAYSKTEAVRIAFANNNEPWKLRYRFHWVRGSRYARHDDKILYHLPFESGTSHRITQGYNGKLSHQGQDRFAIDFGMKEGTNVCAARSGVVVDLKESSQSGGSTKNHKRESNYVCLAHTDGTIAEYHHLQHNGVLVKIGQEVKPGQRIALSGNTGFPTYPHLHFVVYSAVDGWQVRSHPVTFMTRQGKIGDLLDVKIYTAK